jgi:hypothetical protein
MQEITATIRLELDPDPRQASGMVAAVAAAWAEMLNKIDLESVEQSFSINEVFEKPAKRAPRKTKTEKPELGLVKPDEAA